MERIRTILVICYFLDWASTKGLLTATVKLSVLRTLSLPELFVRVRDVRAFVEDSAAVCERKNASCVFVRSLVVCENAPLSVCDACDDCDGEDERENVVFKTHFWKETRMIPSTGSTADIDINGPLNRSE